MPLAMPEVQDTFQRLIDAGKELQKRNEIGARLMDFGPALGFPMMATRYAFAPFDAVGDTLRGTRGVVTDMFRHRDKLEKAVELMADVTIDSLLRAPSFPTLNSVMFPLHKGADGWMSDEQYENLYWPSLKRVMDALIDEGIIPVMFAEGGYETRLKWITDFPKGSVVWWFDQTNMVRAKEALGDKFCIQGNVPSSLLCTGTSEQVKEYCRKLIEDCSKGGGYVLCAGCIPDHPKLECVRAMMAAAKEYGVYKK
jgi:uroporphyrinogen-III decarboxylase